MEIAELKEFLDEKYRYYNNSFFIDSDPVCIPHKYTVKEDIEIAGFLAATIAWGQRQTIIKNAQKLMELMGASPYAFILDYNENSKAAAPVKSFVHRTFNGTDCAFFFRSLQHIYKNKGGLEAIFSGKNKENSTQLRIIGARNAFFETDHPERTLKHFSDPSTGSAAKRLNMFLRWMVRKDKVDFGIWKSLDPARLICPLDVHTGNVSRKLGLLKRNQNDWKAADELTHSLLGFDPDDPVKYDFALFGLGVFEKF